MPFDSVIDRSGAQALMPEDVSREIVQGITEQSSVMRLARRAPNMSRKQQRIPVLASLPTAYFVNGDTGLKQTTNISWDNKFFNAEPLAVIVPIPEDVLDDADYDIWGEVRPRVVEAMGVAFDQAVYYGVNAPSSWPDDIVTAATSAGNVVEFGTGDDIYDDVMAEGGVIAEVEEDGFMVTGHVAAMVMRARLRGLRDTQGQPIFNSNVQDSTQYQLDGEPLIFPRNGAIDPTESLLISGDFSQLVYTMRTDITYKLLTEAVIQDGDGAIQYNLPQQDMVALRAVMRVAWQVPNPINRLQQTEADRYPFGVLTPASET